MTRIEMAAREACVTVSQEPCAGSAEHGYWMAIDAHGRYIGARPCRAAALRAGITHAEKLRNAVCGRRLR